MHSLINVSVHSYTDAKMYQYIEFVISLTFFSEASNVRLNWFLDAGYLVSVKNGPHHPNPLVRHNIDLKYDVSERPNAPGDDDGTNRASTAGWDPGVAEWINKGGDGQKGGQDCGNASWHGKGCDQQKGCWDGGVAAYWGKGDHGQKGGWYKGDAAWSGKGFGGSSKGGWDGSGAACSGKGFGGSNKGGWAGGVAACSGTGSAGSQHVWDGVVSDTGGDAQAYGDDGGAGYAACKGTGKGEAEAVPEPVLQPKRPRFQQELLDHQRMMVMQMDEMCKLSRQMVKIMKQATKITLEAESDDEPTENDDGQPVLLRPSAKARA